MPRYIKDGAYTIVIEDTKSPKKAKNEEGAEGTSIEGDVGVDEQEDEEGDVINFASPDFMLQNLTLARITYQSDKTCMLQARKEIAELMSIQVCYYTYIALQPYVHKPDPPSILLMGDGFIGSTVAHKLAEHGCKPYLKIFSRGEFGSKEWRRQGFISSSSLQHLLKKSKPSVLVLCADYTSLSMIFHQLQELELLSTEMMVIVCTLAAQRKKVYYNFTSPNVFRCYVEPQATIRRLKSEQSSLLFGSKDSRLRPPSPPYVDSTGLNSMMNSVLGVLPEDGEGYVHPRTIVEEDNTNGDDSHEEESSLEVDVPNTPIEKAARLVSERSPEVTKFIHLIENYYCMKDITVEEARRMALRTVVGYVENNSAARRPPSSTGNNNESGLVGRGKKRLNQNRRKPAITVKAIEKILLSLYMEIGQSFHREFSRLITMRELIALAEQNFLVVEEERKEAESKREMYIDTQGKHHLIKLQRGTKAIYERSYIHTIFAIDDAVYDFPGASYDYIRELDALEERKEPTKKSLELVDTMT
jgi:hypothetical protein